MIRKESDRKEGTYFSIRHGTYGGEACVYYSLYTLEKPEPSFDNYGLEVKHIPTTTCATTIMVFYYRNSPYLIVELTKAGYVTNAIKRLNSPNLVKQKLEKMRSSSEIIRSAIDSATEVWDYYMESQLTLAIEELFYSSSISSVLQKDVALI